MLNAGGPYSTNLILAGDIGGTKTLLQLAEVSEGSVHVLYEQRFDSHVFSGLADIVLQFLQMLQDRTVHAAAIESVCFGVAGPVSGRTAKLTNLPWWIDADEIAQKCSFPYVRLINDFEAVGYGIEVLGSDDVVTLQAGQPDVRAPRAVLGAGTGLGVCFLVPADDHYQVVASEGGHMDFAPTDDVQIGLLRFMQEQFGHVSYERILSGAGLVAIYDHLRATATEQNSPTADHDMKSDDAAAAISEFALSGKDVMAVRAMDLFVRIYGAQAGNLTLALMARGGVYVAGGIAPKIIDKIKGGGFMEAFLDKGRYREFLATVPVHVVMNEKVGLLGAALAASEVLGGQPGT